MSVVLVINSGSSSLKYSLIDRERELPLAQGLIERIGQDTARVSHTVRRQHTAAIARAVAFAWPIADVEASRGDPSHPPPRTTRRQPQSPCTAVVAALPLPCLRLVSIGVADAPFGPS